VNTPWAKNFVGAFHHPNAVYCDPDVLRTLSSRDLSAGIAEAIKVAIIGEPTLFSLLEQEVGTICETRQAEVLGEVVLRAAAHKIEVLAPDPYEVDLRRSLNLGHTFAHPLETELEYEGILHGEAVAFGMAIATALAEARGVCTGRDADRIYRLLAAYNLPPRLPYARVMAALKHLHGIRLIRANRLNFVLPERVGRVQITPEVEDSQIAEAIDRVVTHPVFAHGAGG